ncbi:GntR family transcriptional regulator [Agromyces sp. H3Y2-19a]|jgi:DNA-binding FadR family transcriptional regulator|uniref:FadR/GntR family transcriptional regulator n=1 Tax=Agromyces TaxID=33877 RepID=UPI001E458457|nr:MULTISPECIES: GntR family transcriptional regulator [Agromyces]MCD5347565.1 GntR family transcriptional regulator [Agromyces sp. S2-1-8]MDF0514864.1 GntR family transcriptional regulator [Agromyces chromiiresistens]
MDQVPQESPDVLDAGLLLRPARPANAFEETVQRLLQTIRLGLIPPGERLPAERELAVTLEVSRDTLREAIGSLAEAGWVVSRRGRYGGTFVSDPLPERSTTGARTVDRARLEDTLALRAVVEVGVARRAAESELTAGDRDRLWQACEECAAAEPGQYRVADSRLHLVIAEVIGAESVTPLVAEVRMRVNELLDGIPLLAPNIAHSDEQHRAIVSAILRGSADEAAAAMAEHLTGTEALLRGFYA